MGLDEARIVALDQPDGLKARIPGAGESRATLEDVFIALTGRGFEDAEAEKEER